MYILKRIFCQFCTNRFINAKKFCSDYIIPAYYFLLQINVKIVQIYFNRKMKEDSPTKIKFAPVFFKPQQKGAIYRHNAAQAKAGSHIRISVTLTKF